VSVVVGLSFTCRSVEADPFAAAPTVLVRLEVSGPPDLQVHALALRCQVQVEPGQRSHSGAEGERVAEIFGGPERWGTTMGRLQLGFVERVLPGFTGSCELALPIGLSYDVDVAAHKYLAALDSDTGGDIPLLLMFSGTAFAVEDGTMRVDPVPWHASATARLPVAQWRAAMDAHFPGQAWVRVSRETYHRLAAARAAKGDTSWDETLDRLLGDLP
jgi:hypothetical protein